jgi:hypothetical protein
MKKPAACGRAGGLNQQPNEAFDMNNSTQKTPKTQDSQWWTYNCGRKVLFAELVAAGKRRAAQQQVEGTEQ